MKLRWAYLQLWLHTLETGHKEKEFVIWTLDKKEVVYLKCECGKLFYKDDVLIRRVLKLIGEGFKP